MRTETINGHEYEINKLDPFEQLHVGRRLAPLLAHALPAFARLMAAGERPNMEILLFEGAAIPMADILAKMPQEDVDYVFKQCLSACKRRDKKGWARITTPDGTLMYQDIELDTMLPLVQNVVEVSLGRFFPTGQPESPASPSPDSNPSE